MDSLLADLKAWAQKPYDENGSLVDWFLFIGVLTVCGFLWTRVIKRLID